ncbi:hypothetical protein KGP36_01860 [Patescibacteria group bacterium]|nr:hypothetical protein [Patescibacteria group bacterium]
MDLPEPELNRRFREVMGIYAREVAHGDRFTRYWNDNYRQSEEVWRTNKQAMESPITDAEIFRALDALPRDLIPAIDVWLVEETLEFWDITGNAGGYIAVEDSRAAAFKRAVICATIFSKENQ